MYLPKILIDLNKIEKNTRSLVNCCRENKIHLTGVTKVVCGMPEIALAMIKGGIDSLGESRIQNIIRLKQNGINLPFLLLRIPSKSQAAEVVTWADMSLNSEYEVIKALSEEAVRQKKEHKIIIMLDLGDLREGIWPDELMPLVSQVILLPGVKIIGLGTNLTCYGGVIPTKEKMDQLIAYVSEIKNQFNLDLSIVSGGNSSSLKLLSSGRMPASINHLRIGEAILLGKETVARQDWPGTVQDAFILSAEIIELKVKPSVPIGEIGQDAFGQVPVFEQKGDMTRAILNIGRQDVDINGLIPVDTDISILGASSDHLIVDVTQKKGALQIGRQIKFMVNYSALLSVMTSPYVDKVLID